MRKIQSLLAILLFSFAAWGQDSADTYIPSFFPPDYQQIQKDCSGKQGARFYSKLAKRFEELDTTLDIKDLHTFYYGQAYLDGYFPYGDPGGFDQIRDILNKEEEPTIQDSRTIVKLANAAIARCPAEPRAYYYKFIGQSIACEHFGGDTNELEKTRAQFHALFQTIISTGNGLSPELAMHVVSTSHEYMVMNMYGFHPTMQALMNIDGHSYDMFTVESNEYDVDTLYFNIDCIVGSWGKLFPVKEETAGSVTSIDLRLGTKFVLEMKKAKRKDSKFVLVREEQVDDTLVSKVDSLFREPIPENQIVGYFCPMRLYEGDDDVYNCFVFRSNCAKGLYYDTFISRDGKQFNATSNVGMPRGTMMNEMWHDDAQYLRISNIRTNE